VMDHELSVEANELTPTLKVKRKTISTRYATEIDALYAESNAAAGRNGE
jgi:long-chain acyl-CoA synthetase